MADNVAPRAIRQFGCRRRTWRRMPSHPRAAVQGGQRPVVGAHRLPARHVDDGRPHRHGVALAEVSALRMTIGTIGTPAAMAIRKGPFLNGRISPVADRVPSGEITSAQAAGDRVLHRLQGLDGAGRVGAIDEDGVDQTAEGGANGLSAASFFPTLVNSRPISLHAIRMSKLFRWLNRKTAGRCDHRCCSPCTDSCTPVLRNSVSSQRSMKWSTPARRSWRSTPATRPSAAAGTSVTRPIVVRTAARRLPIPAAVSAASGRVHSSVHLHPICCQRFLTFVSRTRLTEVDPGVVMPAGFDPTGDGAHWNPQSISSIWLRLGAPTTAGSARSPDTRPTCRTAPFARSSTARPGHVAPAPRRPCTSRSAPLHRSASGRRGSSCTSCSSRWRPASTASCSGPRPAGPARDEHEARSDRPQRVVPGERARRPPRVRSARARDLDRPVAHVVDRRVTRRDEGHLVRCARPVPRADDGVLALRRAGVAEPATVARRGRPRRFQRSELGALGPAVGRTARARHPRPDDPDQPERVAGDAARPDVPLRAVGTSATACRGSSPRRGVPRSVRAMPASRRQRCRATGWRRSNCSTTTRPGRSTSGGRSSTACSVTTCESSSSGPAHRCPAPLAPTGSRPSHRPHAARGPPGRDRRRVAPPVRLTGCAPGEGSDRP